VFGIPAYTEDDEEDFYENPNRQKNSLYSSMRDCELVLRFVALLEPNNIRGSMKAMLDRAMEIAITEDQTRKLAEDFRARFHFLYELFDRSPFIIDSNACGREKISAALYDAAMVALDRIWTERERIQADKAGVHERLAAAKANDDSYELIVGRRNTAESVKERVSLLQRVLRPK
jgi:hypothetical protein